MDATENPIFIAGSANIDVVARASTSIIARDKPGSVHLDIGGTACNLALNLRSMGSPVRMMTALPRHSPFSPIIRNHLEEHGVDCIIQYEDDLADSVFSAHLSSCGEMTSAISSMAIDQVEFSREVAEKAIEGCVAVVIDCNLSEAALIMFSEVSNQMGLPLFLSAVSEEKSVRAIAIKARIRALFANQRETEFLGEALDPALPAEMAIMRHLGCRTLISTRGEYGALVISTAGNQVQIPAVQIHDAHGNFLGAGDALTASVIMHHVFGGYCIEEAVEMGMHDAARVASTINSNLSTSGRLGAAISKMHLKSSMDYLTGLHNRASGQQKMDDLVKKGRSFYIALLDIDHFKRVNDTFGHDVGDETLKAVACVMSQTLRDNDFCCRWGGEEFLFIITRVERDSAIAISERIRQSIEGMDIPTVGRVTASIGLTSLLDDESPELAVKRADEGLYQAKEFGRNRTIFVDGIE